MVTAPPVDLKDIKSLDQIIEYIGKHAQFKFQITSDLQPLHNQVCYAREKKDALNLLVFDIQTSQTNLVQSVVSAQDVGIVLPTEVEKSPIGLYRSTVLQIDKVMESPQSIELFK